MKGNLVTNLFRLSESKRDGSIWYVTHAKGDGGKDWGWTGDAQKAALLSFGWARRFMADRRYCGVTTAQALEVGPKFMHDGCDNRGGACVDCREG